MIGNDNDPGIVIASVCLEVFEPFSDEHVSCHIALIVLEILGIAHPHGFTLADEPGRMRLVILPVIDGILRFICRFLEHFDIVGHVACEIDEVVSAVIFYFRHLIKILHGVVFPHERLLMAACPCRSVTLLRYHAGRLNIPCVVVISVVIKS